MTSVRRVARAGSRTLHGESKVLVNDPPPYEPWEAAS